MLHQSRFLALSLMLLHHSILCAQSGFFEEDTFKFETEQVSGFSNDGRVKVLLLTLLPKGMSETAAEEIARALQLNLFNTNHFTVVGPSEWSAQIEERDPTLADCHDIACGVLIGKLFNADKVLVGNIQTLELVDRDNQKELGFELSLRMVDVVTNITEMMDTIEFSDITMHDQLFELAVRISQNSLLSGYVIAIGKPNLSIDLGRAHGLQIGRQVVIFRQVSTQGDLEGQPMELATENIAIAEIVRVNDLSSDAIVTQSIATITPGDQVKTYIDITKQIQLITKSRLELDTQKRLRPKSRPLKLEPEKVQDGGGISTGRESWARRLIRARNAEEQWLYSTLGAGAGTLLLLSGNFKLFDGLIGTLMPWVAAGGTIYAGIEYMKFRNLVIELTLEGRNQGYLTFQPLIRDQKNDGLRLVWSGRF